MEEDNELLQYLLKSIRRDIQSGVSVNVAIEAVQQMLDDVVQTEERMSEMVSF